MTRRSYEQELPSKFVITASLTMQSTSSRSRSSLTLHFKVRRKSKARNMDYAFVLIPLA